MTPTQCSLPCALGLLLACHSGPGPAPLPLTATHSSEQLTQPPLARKQAVTDVYHGTQVADEYRWLEDGSASEVTAWSESHNAYARGVLDGYTHTQALGDELAKILNAKTVRHFGLAQHGGRLFAMRQQPPKAQPFLVVMDTLDPDAAKTVLDPAQLDPSGLTVIDWAHPSPDGKLVAVSLSVAGSEAGDVHVFAVDTGKQVYEVIDRVNGGTAGGSLAWAPNGRGFWYTRYPKASERPADELDRFVQVYWHTLGTAHAEDRYELGREFPDIAEIALAVDHNTGRVLATVQDGDSGRFAHWLRANTKGSKWTQFSEFGDGVVQATFGGGNDIYVVDRGGAPRGALARFDARRPKGARTVVVAEAADTLTSSFWGAPSVRVIGERIFVVYQLGGPSEIRVFDRAGARQPGPKHLSVASVGGMAKTDDGRLLFSQTSYVEPAAWVAFDPATQKTTKTGLAESSPVSFADVEVRRELATSKDGTKVPLNILMPKGAQLDGSHPCIVTGYGGFNIALSPRFSAAKEVLLRRGVIWVVANLRGGAEFGEQWHEAGARTNKQNVFDDFAASLEHLVERGYTSADRLGIIGGSNGGLLMGATLVQHPDLMAVVVAKVGIYDMLRVELSPNGVFNIPEFGTVTDAEQFRAMYAYSPFHNVKDGAYPPVLFTTGANDPRVDPMQSRKMTARLQAATGGTGTVLLRTNRSGGHGSGAPLEERIASTAHVYAFLLEHLAGVERVSGG